MKIFRIVSIMFIASMLQTAFISNASETRETVTKHFKKKKPAEKTKKPYTKKETKKTTAHTKKTQKAKPEHRKTIKEREAELNKKRQEAARAKSKTTEKPKVATPPALQPKRSLWSRITESSPATTGAAVGTIAAGTAAATSNRISYAISPKDREKAAQDTSWKKNERDIHKFHEKTYHELVNTKQLRDAKEKNGWHWIKLEHGKEGYAFYNPKCGWMYKINATGEWYQPCKKRFIKQLSFDVE